MSTKTIIPLSLALQQLRLDSTDDLELVEFFLKASEAAVSKFLGRAITANDPEDIKSAVLLQLTAFYENRSALVDKPLTLSPAYRMLLWPYKNKGF